MPKPFHVLVLGNIRDEGLELLRAFAELTILPEPARKQDIVAAIPEVDAVLHKIAKLDAETIAAQRRLRIIARHGVGLDDLALDAVARAGIPLTITPAANSNAVAEATVALALAVLRKLTAGETMIRRQRAWRRESLMGRELCHCTVGIVGFGRVGRRSARLFAAFGSTVRVYDPQPASLADCPHDALGLDELVATSDVVCVHCPLNDQTRHMFDAERISRMRPGAILVNTSRGGLVDPVALTSAVGEGRLAGAGLDVFDSEPPDFDDPLFAEQNILTTPHIAAMTVEAQVAMAVQAAEEVRRVLVEGAAPRHPVVLPFA